MFSELLDNMFCGCVGHEYHEQLDKTNKKKGLPPERF